MEKEDQVYEILLMPIYCDKKHDKISREDNKIKTGQKYRSMPDEDMSDFAIGFYEIIYKDILNSKPLLEKNGSLRNNEYVGDTMNSFNTIANIIPEAGKSSSERTAKEEWPEYLRTYHSKYHCLANFWLLPMEIGRTTKGKINKAIKAIGDYMDRFLEMLYSEVRFDESDGSKYFSCFKNWNDFTDRHFLKNSYLDKKLKVDLYSNYNEDRSEYFIEKALDKIEQRAKCIAKSNYAEELWNYFNKFQLF
ncbi:hypothetical protein [Clostridium beijerinckii]|uniref:hypothetical protein n=1 Tax=Clostridium beijerinckii TaxID=1520 RepID=UPI0015701A50|nr:hypothetical protein [Clostridium beijerinckii]NRT71129.1 hypothetical protein [Clostridium beijerinckii]